MMTAWLASLAARRAPHGKEAIDCAPYVVLDTELTSLDERTNRILSIGAVGMSGSRILLGRQFYRVVNPGVEVPVESILVHRLRPADVATGVPIEQALTELGEFLGDAIIVGHFVRIDVSALRKELGVLRNSMKNVVLDTARAHHWLLLHESQKRGLDESQQSLSLESLSQLYGIDQQDSHHALGDAYTTALLWQRLIPRLQGAGIRTVSQAAGVAKTR